MGELGLDDGTKLRAERPAWTYPCIEITKVSRSWFARLRVRLMPIPMYDVATGTNLIGYLSLRTSMKC